MTEPAREPTTATPPATPARRRRWPSLAAAALLAVGLVLVWFQPQKLFIDERVDEALPIAPTAPTVPVPPVPEPAPAGDGEPAAPAPPPSTPAVPPGPTELATGAFVSLDHGTTGVVRILALGDGGRIVRLEGLDTDNGPDLFVYLTSNPVDGDEGAFDDDVVNLGRLKGNQGNQNYEVPAGVDLTRFATVVIWCDRFNSAFGAAALTAT